MTIGDGVGAILKEKGDSLFVVYESQLGLRVRG